ncbi:MAG: M12 family metallopeptidase [Candidatus Promineifilaceae bacterium]|nr:M12 family metallopeptidase [Candidatus Promineifilaceae bacterium]
MSNNEEIKVCIDRILPEDMIEEAAEKAIEINPSNRPAVSFSPGLGVAPLGMLDLAALTAKKWDNGRVLHVRFLDGDPIVQQKLQPFAHQWSQFANITFAFDDHPDAEIRISFKAKGSWSYLGTDALSVPRHEPTMNFGWLKPNTADDEYSRVVIHEFGHALGCIHEHQNPSTDIPWDKEAVYKYYAGPPNNWDKDKTDHNLFRKYSEDITQFSQFDEDSIMLYSVPNKFTIGDFEVGFNRELSDTDKTFISTLYPKEEKPAVNLTINARSRVGDIGEHGEEDLYQFMVAQQGVYRVQSGGWTDVVMTLSGPDDPGALIAHDDDSGFLWNAMITAELQPGMHFVNIRHHKPQGTGKYRIRVSRLS